MKARLLIGAVSVLVQLVAAGSAPAQTCTAPQGTAAVDQYCEIVPRGGGNPSNEGRSDDAGLSKVESDLPPDAVAALRSAGSEGQALLDLPAAAVQGADPARKAGTARAAKADRGQKEKARSGSSAAADTDTVAGAVEGPYGNPADGYLGWLLLAVAVGISGVAWLRYRARAVARTD